MKKFMMILLIAALVLPVTACGKAEAPAENAEPVHVTTCGQAGPYGSIALTLPEGWDAEFFSMEDSEGVDGLYSIRVYRTDKPDSSVYVGYHQAFGVCGTGLEQKEITLAGDKASAGYYDGRDRWAFIIYKGKNDHVVALPAIQEADAELYDDVIKVLDTLVFDPDENTGGAYYYTEDSEVLKQGLQLSLKNIHAKGATLVWNQWDTSIEGNLSYGAAFTMDRLEKGQWVPMEPDAEPVWTMQAYSIPKGELSEMEVNWDAVYGELEPGTYRIHKTATGPGEKEAYDIMACFVWAGENSDMAVAHKTEINV